MKEGQLRRNIRRNRYGGDISIALEFRVVAKDERGDDEVDRLTATRETMGYGRYAGDDGVH
jgi:hypothetical protein